MLCLAQHFAYIMLDLVSNYRINTWNNNICMDRLKDHLMLLNRLQFIVIEPVYYYH